MKTTDLKTSRKLKELGFDAETVFYFLETEPNVYEVQYSALNRYNELVVKSYDLETILEALPENFQHDDMELFFNMNKEEIGYYYNEYGEYYSNIALKLNAKESLATTAARLLIKLVEGGIIKLGE